MTEKVLIEHKAGQQALYQFRRYARKKMKALETIHFESLTNLQTELLNKYVETYRFNFFPSFFKMPNKTPFNELAYKRNKTRFPLFHSLVERKTSIRLLDPFPFRRNNHKRKRGKVISLLVGLFFYICTLRITSIGLSKIPSQTELL